MGLDWWLFEFLKFEFLCHRNFCFSFLWLDHLDDDCLLYPCRPNGIGYGGWQGFKSVFSGGDGITMSSLRTAICFGNGT
jgi:hypothetical protein